MEVKAKLIFKMRFPQNMSVWTMIRLLCVKWLCVEVAIGLM